ncbi:MAG TPA: ABC transporter permease [Thermotogota bacterium]|nr:ABC transporter permease [Thermotogota bacterium]
MGHLISWDMRFQVKYGFYFVYGVVTVLYVIVLSALPVSWREKAAAVMIFSDPAAMGLFFMGAVILLEKNQRVVDAFITSPLKVGEYIISKVISFGFMALVVALALSIAAGSAHILLILVGTALSSAMFTLLAMIVASGINSLNQFLIAVIPVEIICFVPSLFYLFDAGPEFLTYYPVNICMGMIMGQTDNILLKTFLTVFVLYLLFRIAGRRVAKMWRYTGGIKL